MSNLLGENLRRLRKNSGLTQRELADAAGVSQQAISHIESGRTAQPDEALLDMLGRILGDSVKSEKLAGTGEIFPLPEATLVSVPSLNGENFLLPSTFWKKITEGVRDVAAIAIWRHTGDAMGATIRDGDGVVVNQGIKDIEDSALYLFSYASVPNVLSVKRFFIAPDGKLLIRSDAEQFFYPEFLVEPEEITILGKVVAVCSFRLL